MLPTIGPAVSCWNLNVGSLSFDFCRIHSQAPIALVDHRCVSLAVGREAHHQLRNTHG